MPINHILSYFSFFSIADEPKLNPGAWEDPLPISNANKTSNPNNNHLHSIGSRRSEPPFSALRLSNKLNTNPLSSVAAAAAAAATLQNGNYTLTTLQQNYKNRKRLEHTPSSRTVSSEESCCSERGSEQDFSSDGEDDDKKSITSLTSVNLRNSHLRSTLNKAKQHLSFDKWRGGGASNNHSNSQSHTMPSQQPDNLSPGETTPGGRLSRWFSIRRGSAHQYDFGAGKNGNGRDSRANSIELDDKVNKQTNSLNGTTINGYKMPLLPEVRADSVFSF